MDEVATPTESTQHGRPLSLPPDAAVRHPTATPGGREERAGAGARGTPSLDAEEVAVLQVLSTGRTTEATAATLGLPLAEVQRILRRTVHALGARSTLEALLLAVEQRLITLATP